MRVALKQILKSYFGFYQKPLEEGNIRYFQAKDFDDSGHWLGETNTWLEPDPKTEKHLLQDGDLLFVVKGFRNFAWVYKGEYGPSIASSIFMVLKADREKVLPEYLAAVLNTDKCQAFFQKLGAGSSIPSIRKNELEAVEIPLPDREEQEKVVHFTQLQQKRVVLTKQISNLKNKQYQTILSQMIHQ